MNHAILCEAGRMEIFLFQESELRDVKLLPKNTEEMEGKTRTVWIPNNVLSISPLPSARLLTKLI